MEPCGNQEYRFERHINNNTCELSEVQFEIAGIKAMASCDVKQKTPKFIHESIV